MGMSAFRLRLFSESFGFDRANAASAPKHLWKNFHLCPHCEKKGRPSFMERLDERGPFITRSDGETFHLVLGDRPIAYPAEKSSGKTEMMSAGFWYVREPDGGLTKPLGASTETVVVILRSPPRCGVSLIHYLETVADKLAEKLNTTAQLDSLYEFDANRLHRVW